MTSLAQYALEGYTVGAFDYILKPVKYYDFALKLHWALEHLPESRKRRYCLCQAAAKFDCACGICCMLRRMGIT